MFYVQKQKPTLLFFGNINLTRTISYGIVTTACIRIKLAKIYYFSNYNTSLTIHLFVGFSTDLKVLYKLVP